jgi:negative regulator of sigma E activity
VILALRGHPAHWALRGHPAPRARPDPSSGCLVVFAVLAVGALAASCLVAAPAAMAVDGVPADLLERAQEAAQSESFVGLIVVEWHDGRQARRVQVQVSSVGGVMRFGDEVVGSGPRRLVHGPGGWLTLWNHDVAALGPSPTSKYAFSVAPGPMVADRPTQVVEVRLGSGGRLGERLYLDQGSGLLLRRQVFDSRGRANRTVGFTSITPTVAAQGPSPGAPGKSANQEPAPAGSVQAPYDAPKRLGAGYRLMGAYQKEGNLLHFFYSDGLHGLSVFEQRGRLTARAMPHGGRRVEVGGHSVRSWLTSVGEVMVWEGDGVVYTVVSDAPDAVTAVEDLSHAERPGRLRRVAEVVVSLFRWR